VAVVAQGARISRHSETGQPGKTIAGVPVVNYNLAYGGEAGVSSETKEHWMVFSKKNVDTKSLEAFCEGSSACVRTGHPSEGGVPFFEVFTTEAELEKVLAQAPGQFEFVEPDGTITLDPEEPEEELGAQNTPWGLTRVGVDRARFTGRGSNIYVLDTGVRISHNDFGGRAFARLDLTVSDRLVECSLNDRSCAGDAQGHGTHCAGSAGGSSYGVAPRANILAVKVLSDQGTGRQSWSAAALDFIATRGRSPRIASMSLGSQGVSSTHRRAVDAAVAAGVTVVVAAGNSNADACGFSPAHVPSAITVGSTTSSDRRSSFSNYGSCVNIWAPGSSILSASHRGDSRTTTLSGTSMACPHVSGAAALLYEESSSLSPRQILNRLQNRGQTGRISGLQRGDTNLFLWVGR